ncbi:FtsX-like permease family protein [Mucilaginibacter terrigena]|uniref:FtsX-like permease family protein n=1 Tax=Mucilaginibacter terrigena TaxID=2492395 RepID=A0A4Q5LSG5_9SPHI|nr:ABC transporter permease [Mucilaginibacter terrigena]RYU92435.1 FtsX-like permease family protein [Mucilaginibacter terrigena]
MLKNHFKTAWRNFWKHRVTGFINIAGLSVGMAAAVLIFIWVQNELSFDTATPGGENIFRIKNYLSLDKNTTWVWDNSPYNIGEAAEKQLPEVEAVARIKPINYAPVYFNINGEFFPEENAAYVDSGWFNMFKGDFVSGNSTAFNQHPFSIILSESKAKKYFANQDAIGKTIRIDSNNYQVQAIIKDAPANSSFRFGVYIPVAARHADLKQRENEMQWGNFYYLTFLKLHPGANQKKVTNKIKLILEENRKAKNLEIGLTPLAALHFESDLQNGSLIHGDKKVVFIFIVLGALLLLIACINYVNLTTARASLRAKEVSIKKIVGAGRKQLFAQFVAESALISLMALVLTVIIIAACLPAFSSFTERNFTLSVSSGYLWAILLLTLLATIVLNSIYPAMLLSSFKPLNIFRGSSVLRLKDTSLRKGLVVLQFTFSIFLIVGVITIYRQLAFIRTNNPGYNREQVMSFGISYKLLKKYDDAKRAAVMATIKQSLLSQPAIEAASLTSLQSIVNEEGQSSGSSNDWDGRPADFVPPISFFSVDRDYTKVVNLKIAMGRWFLPGNDDKRNVLLNETAAKEFNLHKPYVGQRFTAGGDTGQVIGIVKDFHFRSMHDKISPVVIKTADEYCSNFQLKVVAHKQAEAIKNVEKIWKANFPGEPFAYRFVDQDFDKLYRDDAKSSGLMSVFAVVAVIISCLGLFGLAAFTAEQRGKEIGIRKVLGASVSGIVSLLSVDFIVLVIVALLIASPLAWWLMNIWLRNFAYRIDMQWWVFILAGVISVLIAFVTVSFQAIKAAIANPVKSLRSE